MKGSFTVTSSLANISDFSAVVSGDVKNVLNWKTGADKDITYYSIRKSNDGENFSEVSRLVPNNTDASLQNYRFTDNNTGTGNKYVYYQIQAFDKKGNSELSEIKMVEQQTKALKLITSLSPNPITNPGHLMLQFNADKEGSMLVQLYNQSGGFIKQVEMSAVKGVNNGHFHVGDITPGTYYIVCTLGAVTEKHTIIVK